MTLPELASSDPRIFDILADSDLSSTQATEAINKLDPENPTSQSSVRRWRQQRLKVASGETVAEQKIGAVKGSIDVTPDGATVNNVVVTSPILTDWGPVFKLFNLSADEFDVVDDTVRMTTWQQSKGLDDGSRDTVQLYSYSARFRRRSAQAISPVVVKEWRDNLKEASPSPYEKLLLGSNDATYVVFIADPQIGKKSTEEAVENWREGLLSHLNKIGKLAKDGFINSIHLAFMGDEIENVMNNYANQAYASELNLSQQLEVDYDLSVWSIKHLLNVGLPLSVSSVVSNHGEWTRANMGSESIVTSRNDNASTYVRRQVKKLFDELEPFSGQNITWTIGDEREGRPGIVVPLSDVACYFSHGYVERGRGGNVEAKVHNAIEKQILGNTENYGAIPLWFMAHYHHFYTNEFQDRTLFGCPALEATGSSEWIRDSSGVWSPAGMMGLVVDPSIERKWSNLNVF